MRLSMQLRPYIRKIGTAGFLQSRYPQRAASNDRNVQAASLATASADAGAGLDLFPRLDKIQFAGRVLRHQDHPIAFNAPHFPGTQVRHDHYLAADDFLRLEMQRNSRDDRSLFTAEIDAEL
jgi:hypothetical protein